MSDDKRLPEKTPDFTIETLGPCRIPSPLNLGTEQGDEFADYTPDDQRVIYHLLKSEIRAYLDQGREPPSLESAGPRQLIYFEPEKLKAGIVTCGGISPGLNNVIRGIVLELIFEYGVKMVYGFQYGFEGLVAACNHPVLELTPEVVSHIHLLGGTILGSSRGPQKASDMADTLERMGIGILFCIGGDGTMKGALSIYKEIKRRGLSIGVIGVPKTIDNDIMYIEKSFGFETAFSEACKVIRAAHVEATGARNGIGIVKLMGRNSGYIAAHAALAERNVNLVLVPEMDFDLEGPYGILTFLKQRIERRHHAVIVVSEGAGQAYLNVSGETDASGNVKLGDIGIFLNNKIREYFKKEGIEVNVKYIDPSYIIRSVPDIPTGAIYCGDLAANAVHAGMVGKTGAVVGQWNGQFVHLPLLAVTQSRKVMSLESGLWRAVLESTGQPISFKNDDPRGHAPGESRRSKLPGYSKHEVLQ